MTMERAQTASREECDAIAIAGPDRASLRRCSSRRLSLRRAPSPRLNEAARINTVRWCARRVRGHNFPEPLDTAVSAPHKHVAALSIPLLPLSLLHSRRRNARAWIPAQE